MWISGRLVVKCSRLLLSLIILCYYVENRLNIVDGQRSHILYLQENIMKKIKIPWMELIVIFQAQLEKIVEDVKEARDDDSKIDKEELKDIVAENVVELIVPITQAFLKKNGI